MKQGDVERSLVPYKHEQVTNDMLWKLKGVKEDKCVEISETQCQLHINK